MSKRLILILALVFVVGLTASSYAEVQNVKVSGDITGYALMRDMSLNKNTNSYNSLITITRVRVDADLTYNVMTTVRLINERYWGSNDADSTNTDIDLDLAMVTLKEFLNYPATVVIGKQELHFGNDMIVGDARSYTNLRTGGETTITSDPDLSMRKSFDALRVILDYNPLTLNLVAAKISEATTGGANSKDDVNLYGINATYEIDSMTTAEAYYWLKDNTRYATVATPSGLATSTDHKAVTTHVLGVRGVIKPMDTVTLQLEGAFQMGRALNNLTKVVPRRAYAIEAAAGFTPKDVKYSPTLTALYAYFTGQKANDDKVIRAWDPMFENQKFGDIANAQFLQSNAHILGLVGTMVPAEDVILKGEYYAFLWDKVYGNQQSITSVRTDTMVMKHRKFAGQEIDLTGTYNYTEDVQFNLLGGLFIPGAAFSEPNDNLGSELVGSMKVTF